MNCTYFDFKTGYRIPKEKIHIISTLQKQEGNFWSTVGCMTFVKVAISGLKQAAHISARISWETLAVELSLSRAVPTLGEDRLSRSMQWPPVRLLLSPRTRNTVPTLQSKLHILFACVTDSLHWQIFMEQLSIWWPYPNPVACHSPCSVTRRSLFCSYIPYVPASVLPDFLGVCLILPLSLPSLPAFRKSCRVPPILFPNFRYPASCVSPRTYNFTY